MVPRVLFCFAVVLGLFEIAHADLAFVSGTRSIGAAVTFDPGDGSTDMTAGPYSDTALSTNSMGPGSLSATASQGSTTPDLIGPTMSGIGDVDASTVWVGPPGFSVMAVSFFDVFFEVDVSGMYLFSADVSWTGSVMLPGGSVVELSDVTIPMSPVVLAGVSKFVLDQGSDSVPPTVLALSSGVDYRLLARTDISGGGEDIALSTALGHWEFSLTAIPEISSFVAMTPLAFVAAYCSWRNRKSKRQTTNAG
jgi:hypothetical protein